MKKILPVVIVIGVVSLVACAGLGSCADGTRVLAQDENRLMIENPRRANYPSDSWFLGAFDTLDYANRQVRRQTGYYTLNATDFVFEQELSDWVQYVYSTNWNRATSFQGNSYPRGIAVLNNVTWVPTTDMSVTNTVGLATAWLNVGGTAMGLRLPKSWLAGGYDLQDLDEYLTAHPIYMQWALSSYTTQSFDDVLNGGNQSEAYQDGLDDYDVPITIHFSTFTGESLVNPFRLEINWWDDEYHYLTSDGSTFTLPQHIFGSSALESMELRISIVSTNSSVRNPFGLELEISTLMSGDCFFDVTAGESFDKPLGLPYYEGAIDIYVNLVPDESYGYQYNNPYYDGSIYFVIDTNNPGLVNVGDAWGNAYYDGMDAVQSDIYEAGRSDGYGQGYNEGYSEGDSHGYRVGYNEGEAAVGEGGLVVANLFGAIAGVPITVLNGLSGLTIWSIPLISVLMSFMFLGIVIWVVKKFI